MTPQQIEAMKLALDLATMHHTDNGYAALREKVRSASKEALAQPEQEPVGRFTGKFTVDAHDRMLCEVVCMGAIPTAGAALYNTPPQRTEQCNYPDCKCPTENPCLKGLAQPEQEPVAWYDKHGMVTHDPFEGVTPLYTPPPQRKPLTNGEIYTAYITATNQMLRAQDERLAFAFARAIEAAHGIKENT